MTTALRMRQMFTRNFPDMSCILRFMTICDDAHDTRVPCYVYRAARVEEVFSSVIFVTPMTAKVLLCYDQPGHACGRKGKEVSESRYFFRNQLADKRRRPFRRKFRKLLASARSSAAGLIVLALIERSTNRL